MFVSLLEIASAFLRIISQGQLILLIQLSSYNILQESVLLGYDNHTKLTDTTLE